MELRAYDMNGLPLSPISKGDNAYLHTSVDRKNQKYNAYAPIRNNHLTKFGMCIIGKFEDARDAAFVASVFNEMYDIDIATQMKIDGTFAEVAKEFIKNIEIPEWQYASEGLTFEEMEGGDYKMNRVSNAKEALIEVIRVFGLKTPPLAEVETLVTKVQTIFYSGFNYREAARKAMGV